VGVGAVGSPAISLKLRLKAWLYPGPDLNIRERGAAVLRHLEPAPGLRLLDAGCGNGYFSLLAVRRELDVVAVSFDEAAVRRCEAFRDFLGIPRARLQFRAMNLYDLGSVRETFDRIICLETLEHILDDEKVVRAFWDRLAPRGRLIIGVPNLDGPDFYGERLSVVEDGGHVRKGYTHAQLEAMLSRVGFTPAARDAYGGGWTRRAIVVQRRGHDLTAAVLGGAVARAVDAALYVLVRPLTWLDRWSRAEPMSVLVVATRP
jgi:SAM-dependent methyltransferase